MFCCFKKTIENHFFKRSLHFSGPKSSTLMGFSMKSTIQLWGYPIYGHPYHHPSPAIFWVTKNSLPRRRFASRPSISRAVAAHRPPCRAPVTSAATARGSLNPRTSTAAAGRHGVKLMPGNPPKKDGNLFNSKIVLTEFDRLSCCFLGGAIQ